MANVEQTSVPFSKGILDARTDVYSFAILMYEAFSIPYAPPFGSISADELKNHVMAGRRLEPPWAMPDAVAQVMSECWRHEAHQRPTAAAAHRMLWRICREM